MKLPQPLFAAVLLLSACAAPAAQRTFDLRAPAVATAPTAGEDGATGDGLLRTAEAPAADAGELAPGAFADVLLFNPERFADHATFANPARLSTGLDLMLVNGQKVIENDVLLTSAAGRCLRVRR